MKIVDSAISMTARHAQSQTSAQVNVSSFWKDFEQNIFEKSTNNIPIVTQNVSPLITPKRFMRLSTTFITFKIVKLTNTPDTATDISDSDKPKILTLERLLQVLFGKRLRFKAFDRASPLVYGAPQGFGNDFISKPLTFHKNQFYQEKEELAFEARGIFKTADGKEINFETDINLSREFATLNNINLANGEKLIDPLVINYTGPAASLTNTKFSFDLDANGHPDQISFLNQGSGFLALDLNGDQKINNGLELFGAKTGDGFNELAAYDLDHNGWIDESDSIFNNLRIWAKDEQGNDQLFALGQKGIGAVYLGNINAPFDFTNDSNQVLGKNQGIGLFAREDGKVGTVQEIDFAV